MQTKGYSKSVIGSREMNQDSFLVQDEVGLYAVADGVGGGLRGEVASRMAVEGLSAAFTSPEGLREVMESLQSQVLNEALTSLGEALMGTTLTVLHVGGGKGSICHVGDSRCYLFSDGHLRQLTEDQEAFDESVQATVLASYLGIPSDIHPLTIQEESFLVTPGQRLLLCTDGLYRQLTEPRIASLIKEHLATPDVLLETLCAEASRNEYSDNVTIVYVEIS